jgi:hypothetical protein
MLIEQLSKSYLYHILILHLLSALGGRSAWLRMDKAVRFLRPYVWLNNTLAMQGYE